MKKMAQTVRASAHGLETVEERRRTLGWKKYDKQWQNKAGVSESTLKRFWKPEDLKIDTFTKICEAVGFDWKTIAESDSLVMGQIICDRYKIVELRTDKEHCKIYLAQDLHLPDLPLCLVTQLSHHSSEKAKELLEREARTLHQLRQHTQIPQLYAYFKNNEQDSYLIKEYIEGKALEEEMIDEKEEVKRWPEAEVISFLSEMLEILSFVHKRNVIHRKIKPKNILIRKSDQRLVLVHFGEITYDYEDTYGYPSLLYPTTTTSYHSPLFVAPEQNVGLPEFSSDLYSLGRIAIQMLTGLALNDILIEHDTGNIYWHNSLDINPKLVQFLDQMVKYEHHQRYQSVETALEEFKKTLIT